MAAGLLDAFRRALAELVPTGTPLVVALSGGGDSVALLLLAHDGGIPVRAAHLDHGLRPESSEDADFCGDLCSRLGIELCRRRVDVAGLAAREGLSVEQAGREARYRFLDEVREGALVATAHTRDDQAETVLMRVLEGCGLAGLTGIHPTSRGWVVRPLLAFRRVQLREYLTERGQPWREDPSNQAANLPRSRIRHQILPVLAGWNPRVVEALANLAETASLDHDALQRQAADHFERHGLAVPALVDLHPAVRRRVLQAAWRRCASGRLERHHLLALEGLLGGPSGKWTPLPGGLQGRRQGDHLVLGPPRQIPEPVEIALVPGLQAIPAWGLELEVSLSAGAGEVTLDLDRLAPPLVIRARRPGDRLRPPGGPGTVKLKKMLPAPVRETAPILCSAGQPVWVPGYRADERFLATPATLRPVSLRVKKKGSEPTAAE